MTEAAAPLPFSSSGAEAIERVVEASVDSLDDIPYDFEDFFNVEETLRVILENNHSRVALQFPDALLWASTRLQTMLQERAMEKEPNVRVCVLADTSYGNCCVDEIAAQHFSSTLIVHYGHACLSSNSNRLSVFYVFGKKPACISQLVDQNLSSVLDSLPTEPAPHHKVFVFYDPVYHHEVDEIRAALQAVDERIQLCEISDLSAHVTRLETPSKDQNNICDEQQNDSCCGSGSISCNEAKCESQTPQIVSIQSLPMEDPLSYINATDDFRFVSIFGRKAPAAIEQADNQTVFLWIGGSDSICLRNLKMRFNSCKFFLWQAEKQKLEEERILTRSLMQRYGLVQKAKESDLIGIVVGTLAVSRYLQMVNYVKKIIKDAGKNYYLYVVGKINPYKLANFPEVGVFVLIACHENSAIDSRDFYKPVITPFELQLALVRGKEWTGKYVPDFRDLLDEIQCDGEQNIEDLEDEEEYTYSLWSESMVRNPKARKKQENDGADGSELSVRNQNTQVISSASAEHYLKSTWRGLEQKIGETEVEKAVPGLSGIPKHYQSEPTE